MKKSISVALACALVLTLGLAAWGAKASPDADNTTKVTGGGWYEGETGDPTAGNHCSLGFQAKELKGDGATWSGTGSFTDRDFRLKTILTITGMTKMVPPGGGNNYIKLTGTAKVYHNNVCVGTSVLFELHVLDGEVPASVWPDRAGFIINIPQPSAPPIAYLSRGNLMGGQIKFH